MAEANRQTTGAGIIASCCRPSAEEAEKAESSFPSSSANEIDQITHVKGSAWAKVEQDGNIVRMPQPDDPGKQLEAVYDAWNRLICLRQDGGKIAEFEYDGLGRRIIKRTFDGDEQVEETRHYFYDAQGRCIQEQVGEKLYSDVAQIDRQYVWGMRGGNDLILRDRPAQDERLYALTDAEGNVVSLADKNGAIQQRFRYRGNGEVEFYDEDFARIDPAASNLDWEYLLSGTRRDRESGLFIGNDGAYHPGLGRTVNQDYTLAADEETFAAEYDRVQEMFDPAALGQLKTHQAILAEQDWWHQLGWGWKLLISVGIIALSAATGGLAGLGVAALGGSALLATVVGAAVGGAVASFAGTFASFGPRDSLTPQQIITNVAGGAVMGLVTLPVGMLLNYVFRGAGWAVGKVARGARRLWRFRGPKGAVIRRNARFGPRGCK